VCRRCAKRTYTKRGQPLKRRTEAAWGYRVRRVTLLMAISASRVVHYSIFDGSCNSARFAQFIASLPDNCPKHVLMDNVAFHRSNVVAMALHKRNLEVVFTPPYSPQFNPIELVFAHVKRSMRRFVDQHGCLRDDALRKVYAEVPDSVLWNCFAHCWTLLSPT
jgi:hypothetical protein